MPNDSPAIPRFTFLYTLAYIMLAVSVASFLALLFQYIELRFPDPLSSSPYTYERAIRTMRSSLAILLVAWPIFLIAAHRIETELKRRKELLGLAVRKWGMYLILLAASLALTIALMTTLTNFFGGELTLRFFLKSLAVFLTMGGVFSYVLWDIQRNEVQSRLPRFAGIGASAVVIAAIGMGFLFMGTPAQQRVRSLDTQRVRDLQFIQAEITNYLRQNGSLPDSLSQIETGYPERFLPSDPETNQPYIYEKKGEQSFVLCASFSLNPSDLTVPPALSDEWYYHKGMSCFFRTASPTFAPPPPPPIKIRQ